ncbi:rhodanese-like domain-containing protein [Cysteiniphilum halobium]|uniref:rhodanese-like domain-containing protein n=1 Tax=Cysteiniphilum halobium TaxID=2219059 RepID=UPI000E64CEBA|nr:rhodanese-like domain-containing protein [Cysteiniphilum halobium]
MSNLSHFISQNLMLCIIFVVAILVYLGYEIRQAKSGRFQLSIQNAINLTNRDKGIFLDIRDNKLFNESHIVGAINSSVTELKENTKILNKYKNNPIIIYCETGSQSAGVCDLLKKAGFDKLYTLKGGFKQWLQDKLPTESKTESRQAISADKKDIKNRKDKNDKNTSK